MRTRLAEHSRPGWRAAHGAATAVSALLATLFLLFLVVPVAELVGGWGGQGLSRLLADAELRRAIALTALTATAATLLAVAGGTPIAYLLARRNFRGRSVLAAILDLPLLIPHPVAGIALLLMLGRGSPIGDALLEAGLRIVSSPAGIVAAMLFVSAPLYISGSHEAFARVDARYEAVARTLGDAPWRVLRRVTLPLAMRGLLAAGIVTWARAVSEFGAIVILAYHPRVASVLIYDRFTTFGLEEALPAAAALVLLALVPLAAMRALRGGRPAGMPS